MNSVAAFEQKFIPEPNSGCFLWLGGVSDRGYGRVRLFGKTAVASRASWILYRGAIPVGSHVLHRCDNPLCVNPDHLFLGTPQDNTDDMLAKGRNRPIGRSMTHCKRGHEFNDQNTYRHNGQRLCKTCRAAAWRRYQARAALEAAR